MVPGDGGGGAVQDSVVMWDSAGPCEALLTRGSRAPVLCTD